MTKSPENTGTYPVTLFVDTRQHGRNATKRIETPALTAELGQPAENRQDLVTGHRILRRKRDYDMGDSL